MSHDGQFRAWLDLNQVQEFGLLKWGVNVDAPTHGLDNANRFRS